MKDLSILIPSGKEMFLKDTIEDILKNIEVDTEVIATLDGEWADPVIEDHERVNLIYVPQAIGQRAATNIACKLAQGKYVMKVDAHCSFDKGFDRKIVEAFQVCGDNVTMVPVMRNLHAFDWKCYTCGSRWYQDAPSMQCMRVNKSTNKTEVNPDCSETKNFRRKMVWQPRRGTHSVSYCFDSEPHFQYFNEYKMRPEYINARETGLTESMSIQGSCFILTREKYLELNICDEDFGNWGNQGIEVACKTWLSGGRVLINHNTWYAHLFRTHQGFMFPWGHRESKVQVTKKKVWESFFDGSFKQQTRPVSWLVEKFWPVMGWTDEDLAKLKQKEK